MQIPIPQNLPLWFCRNACRNIFAPKSRIEILQPFKRKKRQSKNLEKIIHKKQKCHKNHISDLQLQQSVKGFLNIIPGRDSAQSIKQRHIKNQGKYAHFCRQIKLTTPESRVNEDDGNGSKPFGKINIEISFHQL